MRAAEAMYSSLERTDTQMTSAIMNAMTDMSPRKIK